MQLGKNLNIHVYSHVTTTWHLRSLSLNPPSQYPTLKGKCHPDFCQLRLLFAVFELDTNKNIQYYFVSGFFYATLYP